MLNRHQHADTTSEINSKVCNIIMCKIYTSTGTLTDVNLCFLTGVLGLTGLQHQFEMLRLTKDSCITDTVSQKMTVM